MWTRKELKDKAKVSFKANYWKSVLVALILMATIGGMSIYSSISSTTSAMAPRPDLATSTYSPDDVNVEIRDGKIKVDVDDSKGGKVHVDLDAEDVDDLDEALSRAGVEDGDIHVSSALFGPGLVLVGLSMLVVMLIVLAIAIALYTFILSPLEVGAQRFFIRNLNQRAEVKEVAFGYDNNYREVVKTIFLRWLFIFLWSLLLIVPGIYKAYEYRMIPYLLAEDPTMTKDRAFSESKRMMDGHKWNTFVLDLSFLGWNILSALTLGILGAFYVGPYQAQTNAALYEKLRYGLPAPEQAAQAIPVAPVAPAATDSAGSAQMATAPVIMSESQPPIPPFAQVGAEPEAKFDTDAQQLEGEPGSTVQLPDGEADATVPLPESGMDPTVPMPGSEENGVDSDSPDA